MNICVYGASSDIIDKKYIVATEEMGREIGRRGHGLVFGGGASGLMGAAARGVTAENGTVVGVAPSFFDVDGVLYDRCTEFIYTETMRQRKQIMEERADAFIVTPGGIGTFEEFFEILTLKQLNRHQKAIVVFNVNGYFDPMLEMLNKSAEDNFMRDKTLDLYRVFDNSKDTLDYLEDYVPEEINIIEVKNIQK